MLKLWRARPYLTSAFTLACAITLFFAGRFVVDAVYWANHREVQVRGWMTVGYIARSWGLHPRDIDQRAGLPAPPGHPLPLAEIARLRGVPVSDIITLVEGTIATLQAEAPKP